MKKIILTIYLGAYLAGGMFSVATAFASAGNVVFDPSTGNLSVSGSCSAGFVLVVIRKASDNSIWGSSNPPCVHGSYHYELTVPSEDRNGGTFRVSTADGGTATADMASSSSGAAAVVFAPVPDAPTIAISSDASISVDEASAAAAPDDLSWFDAVLQKFFGIATDVSDIFKASIAAVTNLFVKTVAILPGGDIKLPSGEDQISGANWLGAGMSSVFIPTSHVSSTSQIVITPTSPTELPLVIFEKRPGQGFVVGAIRPLAMPVSFDWFIVQTYKATDGTTNEAAPQPSFAPAPAIAPAIISSPTPEVAPTTTPPSAPVIDVATDTANVTDTPSVAPDVTSTDVIAPDPAPTPPTPTPASTTAPADPAPTDVSTTTASDTAAQP